MSWKIPIDSGHKPYHEPLHLCHKTSPDQEKYEELPALYCSPAICVSGANQENKKTTHWGCPLDSIPGYTPQATKYE